MYYWTPYIRNIKNSTLSCHSVAFCTVLTIKIYEICLVIKNWMIASFVTVKRQWYHNLFFFSNWTKIMTFISSTGWGKLTPTVSIILLWIIILKQISRNENLWGRCMCKPQNKSTHLHIGKTTAVIAWQLYKWGDLSAGFGVVGWSAGTPEM